MNIRKYEAFVRAVELGSLSKAAEELGYTQSGISHMMQSLEEIETDDLSEEEMLYYSEVMTRINEKLMEIAE